MPPKKEKKDDKKKDDKLVESPEEKLQQEIARLEGEKADLCIELNFLRNKLKERDAANQSLENAVDTLNLQLTKSTQDYADILEHKEQQLKADEVRIRDLEKELAALQNELAEANKRADGLAEADAQHTEQLEAASGMVEEKLQLEEAVRKQDAVISKQEAELGALSEQIQTLQGDLAEANVRIGDLTLKSSGTTQLKILFDEPWMVAISRYRLNGDTPAHRDGNTMNCFGGKLLLVYGGMLKVGSNAARELSPLQLDSLQWQRAIGAKTIDFLHHQSATTVARTKMMVFGGQRRDEILGEVTILHSDTMKWVTPTIRGSNAPQPRHSHATANAREKVFVFGGQGEVGLLNDMWEWNMDTMHWTQIAYYHSLGGHSTEPPCARRNATLCATEDGKRLWLYGGSNGQISLADLYYFDTESMMWSQVTLTGPIPEPRESHCACIVSKFLMVSGGIQRGGEACKHLADTHILDITAPNWECMDEGLWINSLQVQKGRPIISCFHGNKLYTLKPNRDEKLDELQILEFSLPEDIERMKNEKKKGNLYIEKLELLDEAVCTTNSIEVAWRPPTKNCDRVLNFKVMMATTTGVVKDVYQGGQTACRVNGLRANAEYVFCVKALYDDGSFLWSESKSFHTRT
ncbi:hypothetical protein WJX72_000307 [[Myrmecia] bisecta]|uniref:Fibronectin type-III domain-containing protein n=1 Tax=[Myrmecia] bisecta TaxID=41462 RepID=A0AAW1QNM3_9CHLO